MITLKVNGRSHSVDVDPATPLLYVLSEDLALNGPKFGCGLGQCGACTVIVNGRAIRSCVTPVKTVEGVEITTLEGIGTAEKPASAAEGVYRRTGRAVRLLLERRDHDRQSAAGQKSESQQRRDRSRRFPACCAGASRTCACCAAIEKAKQEMAG